VVKHTSTVRIRVVCRVFVPMGISFVVVVGHAGWWRADRPALEQGLADGRCGETALGWACG
jgi:hypothetical protein